MDKGPCFCEGSSLPNPSWPVPGLWGRGKLQQQMDLLKWARSSPARQLGCPTPHSKIDVDDLLHKQLSPTPVGKQVFAATRREPKNRQPRNKPRIALGADASATDSPRPFGQIAHLNHATLRRPSALLLGANLIDKEIPAMGHVRPKDEGRAPSTPELPCKGVCVERMQSRQRATRDAPP